MIWSFVSIFQLGAIVAYEVLVLGLSLDEIDSMAIPSDMPSESAKATGAETEGEGEPVSEEAETDA